MANVLIVDDQERVRDVVSKILERQGHSVQWLATPGPELYEQDFDTLDLVILDLAMPTRGEEAIYTLRSSGVKNPDSGVERLCQRFRRGPTQSTRRRQGLIQTLPVRRSDGHGSGNDRRLVSIRQNVEPYCACDQPQDDVKLQRPVRPGDRGRILPGPHAVDDVEIA